MKIELAKKSMCNELAKVKLEAWETTYKDIYPKQKFENYNFEEQSKKFENYINNSDEKLYVGIEDDKIIGYMMYGKAIRKFLDYDYEIILLYLLKDYQKRGFGKQFFEFGYSKLKNMGIKEFIISCNKYNENAIQFYQRMGGKIIHMDSDNEDKSVCQVKFLYEVV